MRGLLAEALALTAEGRIHPVIGATYPLNRAGEAHRSLAERSTLGKSLLLVRSQSDQSPGSAPSTGIPSQ